MTIFSKYVIIALYDYIYKELVSIMDDGCSLSMTSEGRLCLLQTNFDLNGIFEVVSDNGITILFLVILLALSAFFSSSETAITAVSKLRVKAMADNDVRHAKTALKLISNFDRSITTILVGNNIVNIAMSSFSTVLAIHLGMHPAVMTLIVTVTVILFGEVLPKALAKELGEGYTLKIAAPLNLIGLLLTPFSALFTLISRLVTKLFSKKQEPTVTEDDVIDIIEDMEEDGSIDSDESRLLYSAFEFSEVSVADILTDRRDVLSLNINSTEQEVLDMVKTTPYSRIPVYRGELDNIIGVLRTREYLESYLLGHSPDLRTLLDTPLFVTPESKIDELLSDMKRLHKPFAVVKTRSGRIVGIVTMEDMLEELVGEIWDENDKIEDKFRQIDDKTFEVSADLSVVSAFEMMDYDDYDRDECGHYTLRKWMGRLLGRVPSVGSRCSYRRLDITAEKVFRGRLISLTFKVNDAPEDDDREDEQ